jgi:hypothetical protein
VPISLVGVVRRDALGLAKDDMAPILAGGAQSARRRPGGGGNRQRSAPHSGWSSARGFAVGAQLVEAEPATRLTRAAGRRQSPTAAAAAVHGRGRVERRPRWGSGGEGENIFASSMAARGSEQGEAL